jgi:DNA-binding NarL/FixJ family response regulator
MIRVPLIKGGRQTVSDAMLAAHQDAYAERRHRLSVADGRRGHDLSRAYLGRSSDAADPPSSGLGSGRANGHAPTRRELQVLSLLAEGFSTREVAARMAYSERTIKNVLQEFTTRLNLRNRTQAVAHAVRHGWI